MTTLEAVYYRPGSSAAWPARVTVAPGAELRLDCGEASARYALAQLRIDSRIGNVPRRILLPDGAAVEVADNDALDAALARLRGGGDRLHRLESRVATVGAALAVTVLTLWLVVRFGLPAAAGWVAGTLPPEVDARLGQSGLALLDRTLLQPSTLAGDRRESLTRMFEAIVTDAGDGHDFRLEFRSAASSIGANALALPSGIVVITDELVQLAESEDELRAVLAHEVGHVVHRHTLRTVMQNSSVVLLVAMVTGDITFASSVAGGLPTLLLEARYSREFEREADAFARRWLADRGIGGDPLGSLLARLEARPDGDGAGFLASHPPARERRAAGAPAR